MKINNQASCVQYQPSFQNKYLKEFTQVIPNTKVAKGLTRLDAIAVQGYINAIPFRMKTTAEEISKLKKFDGIEFLSEAYNFISKKLGFSENVRPEFQLVENIAGDMKMMYQPLLNTIVGDATKLGNISKDEIFAMLRHEYQHYIQNTAALRHETYGETAVNTLVENYVKAEKNYIINLFKKYSEEQLYEIFKDSPETLNYLKNCKKIYERGDLKMFDEIVAQVGQEYKKQMLAMQALLKKDLGVIPENSPLAKKVIQDFEAVQNVNYMNADATIDYQKYLSSNIEQEAISAQNAALFDFHVPECAVKAFKEGVIKNMELEADLFEKMIK